LASGWVRVDARWWSNAKSGTCAGVEVIGEGM
jgi:hypothetical protein